MTDPLVDDIVAQLVDASDGEALIADGFDPALIGLAEVWTAAGHSVVALYDLSICLTVLTDTGMDVEEAAEYIFSRIRMSHETSALAAGGAR